MSLPFKMLHRNVVVGHGDQHRALYRLDTCSYPFLGNPAKAGERDMLARFAYSIAASFTLYRACRAYPAAGYVEQGMTMLNPVADPEPWRAYLTGHQHRLKELGSFVPEVYLAIHLSTKRAAGESRREQAAAALARARRGALILRRDLDALDRAEERTLRLAGTLLPIRRATTREAQWLLRRAASRGTAEPLIDEHWRPTALEVTADGDRDAYRPHRADLERLLDAELAPALHGLHVRGEVESHQAMLTLGHLPDISEHAPEDGGPGNSEFLYTPLEQVPFGVDVALHVRWESNRDARKKVTHKIRDADNELDEQSDANGSMSYLPAENTVLARTLGDYLRDPSAPPLLYVTPILGVGAGTPAELEDRVDRLRQDYGTIALHRPLGSQEALYHDMLLRPDGGQLRHYETVMTVEQFGSLIPHGVHHTGSTAGPYFARTVTGSQRPVKFDVTEATRRRSSPSILLCGCLGSGKTMTGELLALAAALRGSRVVTVDPKDDHRLELLPELAGMTSVVELSGHEAWTGQLDPLVIGQPELREDLAVSYLIDLLPKATPEWGIEVRIAVKAAIAAETPCCRLVLDILAAGNEHARAAGRALSVWADSGLGRLGFSDGSAARAIADTRVTTIRPTGLNLPAPEVPRGDYDVHELVSSATIKLVAAYAMKLVSGDRRDHKLLLFDEAWTLLGNPAGRRLLDKIIHYGRTNNVTLILATQRLDTVAEIEELIGTRLVHGQETEAQAKRALTMLGLDPDDRALVTRLTSRAFRKGRALMKDLDGRVAEIQVDPVYPHIVELLDVNHEAPANVLRKVGDSVNTLTPTRTFR